MQDGDECTCTGGNTECKSPALIEDDQSCGVGANGQARNPGDVWTEDCNTCSCTPLTIVPLPRGKEKGCGVDENGRERQPGELWKDDCNTCKCLSSGTPRCTRQFCGVNFG